MNYFPSRKLLMLVLALTTLCFTACDDDDDVLGIDLTDSGTLFLSSNTSGMVGVLDVNDNPPELETFTAAGMDADGLFYDDNNERVFQVNRSDNTLVAYEDVLDDLDDPNGVDVTFTSSSDFTNGRGLANVGTGTFLVAQDASAANGNQNAIIVYNFTEANGITRSKTINTDINLWGLQAVNGSIYAVVDNSDSVAVFNNLFDTADGGTATPSSYLRIDGLVRTHGIEYDEAEDLMILTDIGDAASDTDGALFIIPNFSTFSGEVVTSANYTKISGPSTLLGNPVDVDYDADDDRIYVAERASGGGQLLIFRRDASSTGAPIETISFPGLSSLFLYRD